MWELIMHTVKLDLKHGLVLVDSAPIAVDEQGVLAGPIAKLCSPPVQTDEGRTQYRLSRKASVCGKSADGVIEVGEGRVSAVTFLFDLIEFFRIQRSRIESTKSMREVFKSKFYKQSSKQCFFRLLRVGPSHIFL